jgi:putative spermidine/putrescine transport system permease protein
MSRKKNLLGMLLVVPGVLFVVLFMLVPLFSLCLTSFFPQQSFSLSSYWGLIKDVYFQQVFVRSMRLSLLSTFVCAVLGFPSAYYISKHSKHKGMMMAFAVFPMFTSPVVRSFSWMVILASAASSTTSSLPSACLPSPRACCITSSP